MLPLPEGLGSIPGQGTRIPQVLWYSQKKSIKTFLPFLATYIWDWRKKWQPTPVFLPGKPYKQRSLVGYSPQGHNESDTTELAHSYISVHACMLSCFSHVRLFATLWMVACQAPLSMGFSRILEWVAISSPGDLSIPGMETASRTSPELQVDKWILS